MSGKGSRPLGREGIDAAAFKARDEEALIGRVAQDLVKRLEPYEDALTGARVGRFVVTLAKGAAAEDLDAAFRQKGTVVGAEEALAEAMRKRTGGGE